MNFLLHVTYASGLFRTLHFVTAFDRDLFAITLKALPVSVQVEDVVAS